MKKKDLKKFKGKVRKDLSGKIFNSLTVKRVAGCNKWNQVVYECDCICGNIHYVVGSYLTSGSIKSCGCSFKSSNKGKNITHGLRYISEYRVWSLMKNRCYNRNDKRYHRYGGRGIEVCDTWLGKGEGFLNFYNDMGKRPSKKYSIDRINNDGNYEPSNCKWSTAKEQARNTSKNHNITYKDKTMCLTDWAKELDIPQSKLSTLIIDGVNIDEYFKKTLNKEVNCGQ